MGVCIAGNKQERSTLQTLIGHVRGNNLGVCPGSIIALLCPHLMDHVRGSNFGVCLGFIIALPALTILLTNLVPRPVVARARVVPSITRIGHNATSLVNDQVFDLCGGWHGKPWTFMLWT